MKKFLIIVATLALMGAGCASSTPNSGTVTGTPAQPNGQTTTNQNPNGPDTFPNGQGPGVSVDATGNVSVTVDTAPTVVTYDGTTFSPSTVTIANGGTVTWKNASAKGTRVASNPHPTHTDYPGFDSKAAINAGQEWSFTFTKSGTWGYHDHFNPGAGGTVIVK